LIDQIEDCNRQLNYQPANLEQMLEFMKHVQEMIARMEINQANLEADRKAGQEQMQNMLTRVDANTKQCK
jgi:hypothetical protein